MDVGYEPSRVIQLSRRAAEAINSLAGLASTDPAAAEAIRTIRLTRSNLEDHWMPALRDIEGSDAMAHWRSSRLSTFGFGTLGALGNSFPDHLRPGVAPAPIPPRVRDELLGQLDFLERRSLGSIGPADAPTKADLRALGNDLAHWVARDDRFADEIVELSTSNMMIGQLLGKGNFSSSFASRVVQHMAVQNGPDTNVDHDRYALSLGTALASLTGDPAACLDLLLDKRTLYALASWDRLDPTILSEFVVSGLRTAVVDDPGRLADGYEVLAHLTRAANGPLDQGFNAGTGLGIATALPAYLDTFAPAVSSKGRGDSVAVDDDKYGISIDFGTYDDLLGLFGAIVRHEDARVMLGSVTASWANDALRAADSLPLFDLEVTHVSEFTSLVLDAAEAEQAQIVARAAADERRANDTGDALALGVDLLLGSRGVAPGTRKIVSRLTKAGINWGSRHELGDATITGLGGEINRQMTVTAISRGVADPAFFQTGDNDETLTDDQRDVAEGRLTEIRNAPNPTKRNEVLDIITSNIEYSPALLPALQSITDNPAAFALVGR